MSNKLVNAFNTVVALQGRDVQIERYGTHAAIPIRVANTNYSRNISAMEELTITGREFIIPYSYVKGTNYDPIKKGDILIDPKLGENSITRVEEMIILGAIAGYRVRTS